MDWFLDDDLKDEPPALAPVTSQGLTERDLSSGRGRRASVGMYKKL